MWFFNIWPRRTRTPFVFVKIIVKTTVIQVIRTTYWNTISISNANQPMVHKISHPQALMGGHIEKLPFMARSPLQKKNIGKSYDYSATEKC